MLPSLSELLQYKHPALIDNYSRNFNLETRSAELVFEDMLRYLWLSAKHREDCEIEPENSQLQFSLVMHEEMRPLDEMWHNFILYTRDYTNFCQTYFGQYLHHQPDMALTLTLDETQFSEEMEKYLSYLWENLGEEIVCRWFSLHLPEHDAA